MNNIMPNSLEFLGLPLTKQVKILEHRQKRRERQAMIEQRKAQAIERARRRCEELEAFDEWYSKTLPRINYILQLAGLRPVQGDLQSAQDGLALSNSSGIAYAFNIEGYDYVTDDKELVDRLRAEGVHISFVDRSDFGF